WPLQDRSSAAVPAAPVGSVRVSVGRATRRLAGNPRSRRDLRCEDTKPGVVCTFLSQRDLSPYGLAGGEIANVLVWAEKDGRIGETNIVPPPVSAAAFRSSRSEEHT